MKRAMRFGLTMAFSSAVVAMPAFVPAEDKPATQSAPATMPVLDPKTKAAYDKIEASIMKGLDYLKTQQQADHGWQKKEFEPPALTALPLKCFVQDFHYDAEQDFVDKGYDKLTSYQLENGGIYKDMLACYNTAIAISAMAAARDAEYQPKIDKAVAYLRTLQWHDKIAGAGGVAVDPSSPEIGGFGYGRHGHADGSNEQLALDALHDAGVPSSDPAFQNALKFVTRLQNLSEQNDQPNMGNDGGSVYAVDPGVPNAAGEYVGPDGKKIRRSYGSMTYAGLKSMMYAGLNHDDARVKAAWGWITRNYTLDENPGMKENDPSTSKKGLFYYYHTMARALYAYNQPVITDAQGKNHDWRTELGDKLASLQNADGSWVGDPDSKWMEDNPVLTTCYSILALQEAQKDLAVNPVK